ncbi:SubName: Full=Uncharacterized protein {ECO:0000313/EMBL:CCA68718.1} [Serendipita indica DSM 11827]|nr:SubName: Full=Uncharacterized protein {ECO:0000313/EMBL:CCA68718.1} [Serendipita indica DSM 11827]
MASTSLYQPPISSVAAANIFGPPQRSNSPAVGGRRKVAASAAAVPAKPAPVVVAPTVKATGDLFYGYEDLSKMCGRFIGALFSCPNVPMFAGASMSGTSNGSCPPLAHFIAYAIHRTRLPEVVVFTALFLLARLKERFPAARGSSGHRLFISAFMIASKVICDDTYSNKSWCIVGQNLYTLKEVNQMEREMCSYLEWILHVEAAELEAFTQRVKKEYGPECGPVPPAWVSSPVAATAPATSVAAPLASPVESTARSQAVAPSQSYPSPRSSPPTPSHSNTASPLPLTNASPRHPAMIKRPLPFHPSDRQTIADPSFAFASRTVW